MSDAVDMQALREAGQKTWSEGDFAVVAAIVMMVSEELVEALDVVPGERVLDVACGSGNAAIAAARRTWGNVVGADFVPALLERARERAAAERLEIEFVAGDAADLPFGEGEFDVVTSVFGAMFAPDQQQAANELLRVCKPGGRIGMANWVPDGRVSQLFGIVAKHAPPPPGFTPPVLWGTEEHVGELFGDGVTELRFERKASRQPFRSIDHYLEIFRNYFGPIKLAFDRVGPDGEAALEADLREQLEQCNTAGDHAFVLEPEYLQVIAKRAE
ncbi:MAG TPA: methyltransferase domain-containing protein [Solirubrobacterales bacterium]|jgi:ubiquinone/menaquinone biosynthesis C-methylase UbiE|nr:methyltransferase domain-containing protein [Solirubrobacterales bacterium]